jgi:hypothetical protein
VISKHGVKPRSNSEPERNDASVEQVSCFGPDRDGGDHKDGAEQDAKDYNSISPLGIHAVWFS